MSTVASRAPALLAAPSPTLGTRPNATFALVLTAVSVSVIAMRIDAVPRYSEDAFFAGTLLTIALAIANGKILEHTQTKDARLLATVLLPAAFGALIGVVVQAIVLAQVRSPIRDLGGLVSTPEPLGWVASGLVLGGIPALAVSLFLVLASRALARVSGHDAFEHFHVAFVGFAGVLASVGLFLADDLTAPPLGLVVVASMLLLVLAIAGDTSRARFLRSVYAGEVHDFEIAPIERFRNDPSLRPIVGAASGASVLVRLAGGFYRSAATEPVAIVGATERDTLRPLVRRRAIAAALLLLLGLLLVASATNA